MTGPLVTAVVPVYDGARFLRQSLGSALDQTYHPLEIIAVDDGSTDESADIIRGFGDRVTLISQANQGVAAARNAGLRAARGELIAFLDQDDWWRPGKIARQVERFVSDDTLGLVHTNVSHYDDAAGAFTARLTPVSVSSSLVGWCFDTLILGNGIYNSSVMIRRRLLDTVGYLNVGIHGNTIQDYDLWLRLARHSSFAYLDDELTVFRLHATQGTWKRRAMLTDELHLLERVVGKEKLLGDPGMRHHLAEIMDELALEHLEAGERPLARQYCSRLLRARFDARSVALYTASFLPSGLIKRLRDARDRRRFRSTTASQPCAT